MFGMDALALPQIDPIVLDFPISLELWNGGAQSVDFGSANWQNVGFCPSKIFMGHI